MLMCCHVLVTRLVVDSQRNAWVYRHLAVSHLSARDNRLAVLDYEAVDPIAAVVNMTAILPNNAIANYDNKVEAGRCISCLEKRCFEVCRTDFLPPASPEAGR
jgi:hypothetical protein